MAFTPLVPQVMSLTVTKTMGQAFVSSPVLNAAGAVVSLAAWVGLTAQITPAAPNPTGAPVVFGTVTATSGGVITIQTNATDLATVEPGSARLTVFGKPTSGDINQLLATGVVTVQNP